MKRYIKTLLCCLLFTSCMAQNSVNKFNILLEKIYENQLAYYNNKIADQDNYTSIINFAKQERSNIILRLKDVIQSDSFVLLEGFSSGWGDFTGLIWNSKVVYSYRRSSTDKRFNIVKVKIKNQNLKKVTGIDPYIFDRIKQWDVNYINSLKNKIGAKVSDGYNFMATKVTYIRLEREPKIETIGFEQFINEE